MLSTYSQCIKKYLTDCYLKKAIEERLLYKVENGIYSDSPSWPEPAVIAFKNSGAVFTMNSAFYYRDLTDAIPDYYYPGTEREASRIRDKSVKQVFYPEETLMLGVEEKTVNGISIRVYPEERLLIELIRHRNKLSFDYYKEIIGSYRRKLYELDEERLEDNIDRFPGGKKIMTAIRPEVC